VIVMGRHSISAYHDNGSLIWTWRLTLTVGGAGLLLEGVTAVLWAVGVRVGASGFPAVLGVVALFVAISGRIGSAIKLRYAEERLPAVPAFVPGPSGLRPRRRVVWRWSGFAWLMMAIIVCLPVSIVTDWNAEPTGAQVGGMTGSILLIAACWLLGPAARFVVTREHLHIDTGFRRTSVPRKLLAGFLGGGLEVRAELTDGDYRDFRVDTPLLDLRGSSYRSNVRCRFRTIRAIVRALGEVSPLDTGYHVVVTRARWGPITLAAGAVLATAVVTTLLV
jgi:hypothetical protein